MITIDLRTFMALLLIYYVILKLNRNFMYENFKHTKLHMYENNKKQTIQFSGQLPSLALTIIYFWNRHLKVAFAKMPWNITWAHKITKNRLFNISFFNLCLSPLAELKSLEVMSLPLTFPLKSPWISGRTKFHWTDHSLEEGDYLWCWAMPRNRSNHLAGHKSLQKPLPLPLPQAR